MTRRRGHLMKVFVLSLLGQLCWMWKAFWSGVTPFEVVSFLLLLAVDLAVLWVIWLERRDAKRAEAAKALAERERQMRLERTFELRLPTNHVTAMQAGNVVVPLSIAVHHTTDIHRFNLRFVDENLENVPAEIISIASVQGEGGYSVSSKPDEEGGCDCWSGNGLPIRIYARKALPLMAHLRAPRAWSGQLSFQGYDEDGNERYSRLPFVVEASNSGSR